MAEVTERSGPGRYAGRAVMFRCPNPDHEDRHPSFSVDTETGRWACWSRCGRSGDVIELIEWLDGLGTRDALDYLARRYGLEPDTGHDRPRARKAPPAPRAPKVVTPATDTARPHPDPAKAEAILDAFLELRGWTREVAELVGLSVVLDKWGRARVRFPFTRGGEVLLWQDRATAEGQNPKWLTPAGATLFPFGLDTLAAYNGPPDSWPVCPVVGAPAVWLVEGPADAVTLRTLWPDLAVLGLPGTGAWQDHYAAALTGLPVVVVADNDDSGDGLRVKVTADLHAAGALPVNLEVPAPHNDVSEWYVAAGWERFAAELLEHTDDAADAVLDAGEVTP